MIHTIIRYIYAGSASYKINQAVIVSSGGKLKDRWEAELNNICHIHNIANGIVIVYEIDKRWRVKCFGKISSVKQSIMNILNL